MWLFFNRFIISRNNDDLSSIDIVDEIAEICYQWAISRSCFSKSQKFRKWGPELQGVWPSPKSMPLLSIENSTIDAPLDWMDLPEYICEFRDWRMTLKQYGHGVDDDSVFIHHIHLKRIDEMVEFSILQETPKDEDNREWEDLDVFPPSFIDEITSKFVCEIKDYIIENKGNFIDYDNKIILERNILDEKRRLPLILIPRYFRNSVLSDKEISDFTSKLSGFAEIWIYDEEDRYYEILDTLNIGEGYAIIFKTGLSKIDLYGDHIDRNKILNVPHDNGFETTSQIIVNEILRPTRFMRMKSVISRNVQNALIEKEIRVKEKINSDKLNEIINKTISEAEKNDEYISQITYLNNELMISNNKNLDFSRENEKLEQTHVGLDTKLIKFKSKYNELKKVVEYQEELNRLLEEKNISFDELRDKLDKVLDINQEDNIDEEIEFVSLTDVVKKSIEKFPDITFSSKALQSSKNADNSGKYGHDDFKKVHEIFYKLNKHFFDKSIGRNESRDSNKFPNFYNEIGDLFPGKFSDESTATLSRIKKYSGNDRRIYPILLPEKGEFGVEITWHIKPTSNLRIYILCLHHLTWDLPLWRNHEGKWYRAHKQEKGTPFGKDPHDFPKIIIGYCGEHLKIFSNE